MKAETIQNIKYENIIMNLKIAAWNLNNRVGKVRFKTAAANAGAELNADVLIFNEFYPGDEETNFRLILNEAGYSFQIMSVPSPEKANRVLIVSRLKLELSDVALPMFDHQFQSNIAAVKVVDFELELVGLRIPAYGSPNVEKLKLAWEWVTATTGFLTNRRAIIIGDFNTSPTRKGLAGDHLRKILGCGWRTLDPLGGASYFGPHGSTSAIDHFVCTPNCGVSSASYTTQVGSFQLAQGQGALSDHAALVLEIVTRSPE